MNENHRSDRRIQKTLQSLNDALISLLFEKNYDSIVVQEILDRANVGRSTFYMHFRDKDALLMKSVENLQGMLRRAQAAPLPPTAKPYDRLISFSLPMFEHSHGFRIIFQTLLRSQAGPLVMQTIRRTIVDLISEESKKRTIRRNKDSTISSEVLIEYLAGTFISVLTWWVDSKSTLSPKSINQVFRALVVPTMNENLH
jgi:AcrR family transcriptional regulator